MIVIRSLKKTSGRSGAPAAISRIMMRGIWGLSSKVLARILMYVLILSSGDPFCAVPSASLSIAFPMTSWMTSA